MALRILQLCKKFPWPLKDGEAIACTYLARAYRTLGCTVDLLSMNTSKHWFDLRTLPPDFDHYGEVHTVFIDNRIRPWPAFKNLFGRDSYHIERFEQADFAEKLRTLLQTNTYDVVQLESIYLASYLPVIRANSAAKVVLRAHNVEHEIWERVAEQSSPLKKWYLRHITPRLKNYEVGVLNDFDLVVSISERDGEQFRTLGLHKPIVNCPIGLQVGDYEPDWRSFEQPLSLSFIGSLDWMPNQDGLRWFLDEVWKPLLLREFPELTLHIAGRTAPAWLRHLDVERVVFHGEVDSAVDFLNAHPVMIAPLLSGGGMKAKVLEAFAVGRAVISTSLGMEGIPAVPGEHYYVADAPEQWVTALRSAYSDAQRLRLMGERGREFCLENFDNVRVANTLIPHFLKKN
jgi:polysaccharide biosynthesis protein PslH